MTIGIYGLFSTINEVCLYVGQSKTIEGRFQNHRGKLSNDTHLTDFVKYFNEELNHDLDNIDFRILDTLEFYDKRALNILEAEYFRDLKPLFYGQVPSLGNHYMVASPDSLKQMGDKLKQNVEKARISFRFENGRRIWTRSCLICSTVFESSAPTAAYCSTSCRIESKTFKNTCKDCGETFEAKSERTKWCHKCKYLQNSYERICVKCELPFMSKRLDSKYCSRDCKVASHKEDYAPKGYSNRTCKQCSDAFKPESPTGLFCSEACRLSSQEKPCIDCGVPVSGRRKLCEDCKIPHWQKIPKDEFELVYRRESAKATQERFNLTRKELYKTLWFLGLKSNHELGIGRPGSKEFNKRIGDQ